MWNNLPSDLLAHIFSFLPPDALACAKSACRNWHQCPSCLDLLVSRRRRLPPWFVAMPHRNQGLFWYAQKAIDNHRYMIDLDLVSTQIQPISPVGGFILFRPTITTAFQLTICNPFTRQFRQLPMLNLPRSDPAVAAMELSIPGQFHFRVYVVGGLSEVPTIGGICTYDHESTMEMYDSKSDSWMVIGTVPLEYGVRLTFWAANEGVNCNGVLYWMTSSRAYSVIGFDTGTNKWKELSVPIADRLEFAELVMRNGKLTVLGGKCGGDAYVWELGEGEVWSVIEKVPFELAMKFLGGKGCWDNTKCAGTDGMVCLYKDLGSGMLAWREVDDDGRWEWFWIDGCSSIRGQQVQNLPIKGLLLHPNLTAAS